MSRFRVLAVTLIFSLCFSFSSWAVTDSVLYDSDGFAKQVNTYKDLALSASNALKVKSWDNNVSVASSIGSVTNTVDFSGSSVRIYDVNTSKWSHLNYVSMGGTFSGVVPSGASISMVALILHPNSLPAYGTYDVELDYASDSSIEWGSVSSYMQWTGKNQLSKDVQTLFKSSSWSQSSGDLYLHTSLDLKSNISSFNITFVPKYPIQAGSALGGKFSICFNQSSGSAEITSPGTAPSDTDIQSGIASTTSQIASSVNDVYDSIHDLMQHISNQLAALWDQMYNYMHVPTYNKLQEILQAIQAIQLKVNVDVSSVVDAVDNSADRITDSVNSSINNQISNDNKNADDIKNGYDNSGMKADNDRLNDKISQYDTVEDQLFDDAKDKIGNFSFDNPLTKYTDVLSDISYFLSGIYTALGALNIPVGFSLTLTIALIFIGYYRFKGGS